MKRTLVILTVLAAGACSSKPADNSANHSGNATNTAQNGAAPAPAPTVPGANNMAAPAGSNVAAAPQSTSKAEGCAGEIGLAAAERLVEQCVDVSPATRPPCNAANACSMIRDEIERGCGMLGADAPAFCKG